MSKSKKKKPNHGANRQQRRDPVNNNPQRNTSSKPMWLRVMIIAALFVLVCGFVIVPLIK